jgi:hypothetical protein
VSLHGGFLRKGPAGLAGGLPRRISDHVARQGWRRVRNEAVGLRASIVCTFAERSESLRPSTAPSFGRCGPGWRRDLRAWRCAGSGHRTHPAILPPRCRSRMLHLRDAESGRPRGGGMVGGGVAEAPEAWTRASRLPRRRNRRLSASASVSETADRTSPTGPDWMAPGCESEE